MIKSMFISPYENLPVAVYTCDKQGTITSCNQAATSLWGRSPALRSEKWSGAWKILDCDHRLISPEEYPSAIAIKEKKIIPNAEYILEQPNGNKRNVLISSVPTFNEYGEFTGTINTVLDVTEQKANEAREATMIAIIESSEDAIISKSLDGIILSWNPAAETMFGYRESEAVGKHVSLIIPYEKFEEETFIINKVKKGRNIEHLETYRIRKDGTQIPISLTVSPIRNSNGVVIGASKIARDITRQQSVDEQLKNYALHLEDLVNERTQLLSETVKTLEKTKEDLNEALANERQMGQLKSRFVSMASHEFRTPLSAIKLSSSLIEKYAGMFDTDNVNKHVGKIKNAVSNLTNILNEFLSLEKLEAGKVKADLVEFDLIKFLEELKDEMQMIAKSGQLVVYQHTGTSRTSVLDPNLLRNCLINLVSNAIKYSAENEMIELDSEIRDGEVIFTVKDHGIGVPEDEQKHLFEAFFRANNTGAIPGTGLGLNIVSRYTALMNGNISFESTFGKGSQFILRFPVGI